MGDLGFDFRAGEIGHNVANGEPLLRYFFVVLPGCKAAKMDPATRYTLWRNIARIMENKFFQQKLLRVWSYDHITSFQLFFCMLLQSRRLQFEYQSGKFSQNIKRFSQVR